MSERRAPSGLRAAADIECAVFWDGVESEVESLDPGDFAEFLAADGWEVEPRPEFEFALAEHLRGVIRRRWAH